MTFEKCEMRNAKCEGSPKFEVRNVGSSGRLGLRPSNLLRISSFSFRISAALAVLLLAAAAVSAENLRGSADGPTTAKGYTLPSQSWHITDVKPADNLYPVVPRTAQDAGAIATETGGLVVVNLYTNPQEDTGQGVRHIPASGGVVLAAADYMKTLVKYPPQFKVGFMSNNPPLYDVVPTLKQAFKIWWYGQ